MSDVVPNADECVRALEQAIEAMQPPLDVFGGILSLIAGFVPYVRFNSGFEYFTISGDGARATRNSKESDETSFVCVLPIISEGTRGNVGHCADFSIITGPDELPSVHKATFRIDKCAYDEWCVGVGVIPESKASSTEGADKVSYMLSSDGEFFAKIADYDDEDIEYFEGYGEGDTITVRLDLDVNTIAFRKNGEDIYQMGEAVPPQAIEHDEYYFAFVAVEEGDAVTIVEMK